MKKITSIKPRKNEQKYMSKVNVAYIALNKAHSVDAPDLAQLDVIKIDRETAEKIVHDYKEEQKKIAAETAEKKKKDEEKRVAEEKAAAEEAQRIEDEKKAAELAKVEQQKAEEAEKERIAQEEKAKAQEAEQERIAQEEKAKAEEIERAEAERVRAQEKEQAPGQVTQNENTGGTESFQNCTELRKTYPNGVGSDHPAYTLKMDRDKDNWACER